MDLKLNLNSTNKSNLDTITWQVSSNYYIHR